MEPELRIPCLDGTEQILVPLERKVRIVPSLEEQLPATERDGLVDLLEDLLEAEDVAFVRADRTVERAEVTPRDADVRVVDVAVDDVADNPPGMLPRANAVGEFAEERCRRVEIQVERFVAIDAVPVRTLAADLFECSSSRIPHPASRIPVYCS